MKGGFSDTNPDMLLVDGGVGLIGKWGRNRANFWLNGLIIMGTEQSELFAKLRTRMIPAMGS